MQHPKSASAGIAACSASVLAAILASAAPSAAADFKYVDSAGYTNLLLGETLVMRHMTAWDSKKHGETFKTFHHLYGFHGDGQLTKGPGGEFTHHRGFFMGWSQTAVGAKTMDSWHGSAGSSTRHIKYLPERELTGATARRASVTEWTMQDNSVIVRDTREVAVKMLKAGMLQIDWKMTIASATTDSVVLKGDPQHAGFQFRADSSIKTFEYLGPTDKTGTGDVWTMKNSNSWAVSKFALKTHGYSVMQMDHPLNPRPVQVSHRDYGRFGHFFETVVKADKPLTFYFRSLIVDTDLHGAPTVASAQALYDEYAKADLGAVGLAKGVPLLQGRAGGWKLARNADGILAGSRFDLSGRQAAAARSLPGLSVIRIPNP